MQETTRRNVLKWAATVGATLIGAGLCSAAQDKQEEGTRTFKGDEPEIKGAKVPEKGVVRFKGHSLTHNDAILPKNRYYSFISNKTLDSYVEKDHKIKFSFTDDVVAAIVFQGVDGSTGFRKFDIYIKEL